MVLLRDDSGNNRLDRLVIRDVQHELLEAGMRKARHGLQLARCRIHGVVARGELFTTVKTRGQSANAVSAVEDTHKAWPMPPSEHPVTNATLRADMYAE